MPPVLRAGALKAREERWKRKLSLVPKASGSLCVLTLRMPHALRMSYPASRLSLDLHFDLLSAFALRGWDLSYQLCLHGADGPESYFLLSASPGEAKEFGIRWEEDHPLGGIADFDVMDPSGNPLSRESFGLGPRPCLVCQFMGSDPTNGVSGAACAARQAHPAWEVESKVRDILVRAGRGEEWLPYSDAHPADTRACGEEKLLADRIARAALSATLREAALAPKPGLVSPESRGSHDDMDYGLFLASARALAPYFSGFAALGRRFRDSPGDMLPRLRPAGREAESAMFTATGGVNTHKGLIFSLGLLCAAAGSMAEEGRSPFGKSEAETPIAAASRLCGRAALIAGNITEKDLAGLAALPNGPERRPTYGETLYMKEGIRGVRGEAQDGFPSVLHHALPKLEEGLRRGIDPDEAALDTLLLLFTVVEDTNVLARAGAKGLGSLKSGASAALAAGGASSPLGREKIRELDETLRALRASPGGCADLLALTFFLHDLCG